MSFSPEQIKQLEAPLLRGNVKSRTQAGRTLSYIEGWKAIAEANRIFGFDGWDRETLDLTQCGEPRLVEGKHRVAFMCRVRVTVRPSNQLDPQWWVKREGTGYGSGIDKDLGQAFESAMKEAETDAMKRALMTFGNPFGLALYDKEQANVVDEIDENWADTLTASQLMAEGMIEALRKRRGPEAIMVFLNKAEVKRDLDLLDIDEHTLVMGVAAEQKALEPAVAP